MDPRELTFWLLATMIHGGWAASLPAAEHESEVHDLVVRKTLVEELAGGAPEGQRLITSAQQRFICVTQRQDGSQVLLVHGPDGSRQEIAVGDRRQPVYSQDPDDVHFAVVVQRDWKQHVVVDGKSGPGFDRIHRTSPTGLHFSEVNGTFAALAEEEGRIGWLLQDEQTSRYLRYDNDQRRRVLLQVRDGGLFPWVTEDRVCGAPWRPRFPYLPGTDACLSDDHQHTFYFVNATRPGRKAIIVVVDGKDIGEYSQVQDYWFTPQGGHFAYVGIQVAPRVTEPGRFEIVVDGCTVEQFANPGPRHVHHLWLSPNGQRDAYSYTETATRLQYMAIDGRQVGPFDRVEAFSFTPGSDHYVLVAFKGATTLRAQAAGAGPAAQIQGRYVVHSGQEYGPFPSVAHFMLSPDGQRLVFHAGATLILDGRPLIDGAAGALPVFSDDSRHIACAFRRSRQQGVMLDGQEGPPLEEIAGVFFAPDSADLYYIGSRDGRRTQWVFRNHEPVFELPNEPAVQLAFCQSDQTLFVTPVPRPGRRWSASGHGPAGVRCDLADLFTAPASPPIVPGSFSYYSVEESPLKAGACLYRIDAEFVPAGGLADLRFAHLPQDARERLTTLRHSLAQLESEMERADAGPESSSLRQQWDRVNHLANDVYRSCDALRSRESTHRYELSLNHLRSRLFDLETEVERLRTNLN